MSNDKSGRSTFEHEGEEYVVMNNGCCQISWGRKSGENKMNERKVFQMDIKLLEKLVENGLKVAGRKGKGSDPDTCINGEEHRFRDRMHNGIYFGEVCEKCGESIHVHDLFPEEVGK